MKVLGNINVDKKTITESFQMTSTPQNGYVLTSDADGVGSWQPWTGGLDKYITGGTYNEITEQIDLETNSGELISIPVGSLSVDTDGQTLDLTDNILTINKSNSTVDLSAYVNQSNLWTENGTKIYRNSKVGIGTENPAAELEIQGDSLVDIGDVNATQNDNNAYNNVSQLKISNDNNSMTFFTNGTNNVRKSFIQVGHDSASWANGVGELSLNPFGGNVGIGTTDPDEKLHITGLFKTTNNGKYITIGNEDSSYAHFSTDAPRFLFNKEIVITSGNIKAFSSQDLTLQTDATNRLRIDGAGGAITFNNTYTFPTTDGSADQVLKTDGAGQLSWTTISAGGDNLWTELNGNVYRSTGNVGIGKSNPSTKLHVGGALTTSRLGTYGTYDSNQVQGIWSIGNNYSISTANNDFGSQYGLGYSRDQAGGSPLTSVHQITFTQDGAINAAIGLDGRAYFSDSVGIGGDSDIYDLQVKSVTYPWVNLQSNSNNGSGSILAFQKWRNGSTYANTGDSVGTIDFGGNPGSSILPTTIHAQKQSDGISLEFLMSNDSMTQNSALYLAPTGRVGVNTTSPDTNLHVAGSIKITGGNPGDGKVLTSDANGLASWQTISVGDTNTDSQTLSLVGTDLSISGGNNVNLSSINTDTNYYLDSASMVGNTLTLGRNGGLSDVTVDLSQFLDNTNLWTENGNDLHNANSGNVGINKTNPTSNLHVDGSIAHETTWSSYNSGENLFLDETHSTVLIHLNNTDVRNVVLPLASTCPGRIYTIKLHGGEWGTGQVSVSVKNYKSTVGDKIDAYSDWVNLVADHTTHVMDCITLQSAGGNIWWIISHYGSQPTLVEYTGGNTPLAGHADLSTQN